MPITKDAFYRYRILDKCFRNKAKNYQIGDLVKACNNELRWQEKSVSRRTIYYDIEFMKSSDGWEAPIEVEEVGNRHYYFYSDPDFSIDKMPMTEAQLKQIQSSIDLLNSFDGLPQFEGLSNILDNIGLMVMNTSVEPCMSFEHNEYLVGKEHITALYNAIQYKTVLMITYKPYDGEAVEYVYHPQFLKQYNNRWYIFGVEENHLDDIWNFAIDRIQNIKVTQLPYIKKDVDWNEYFDDIIGVTNYINEPVENIHFLVHGKTGHYIKTKPLHGSQVDKWIDDDTLDVKLQVKINYELKRLLLSYADSITILAPQRLVEEHKESLRRAMENANHC